MLKLKALLSISYILFFFAFFANHSYAQENASNFDVTVSPVFFDFTAKPGTTVTGRVRLRNNTTTPLPIKVDIKKLGGEITQKNQQIQTLVTKIETEKESLAQLIRKDREIDDKSMIAFVLSQETMSEAYGDIATFSSIKLGIKKSVDEIRNTKTTTEVEKKSLEKKKDEEIDVKVQLENAKKQVEANEANKQQLLSISKNKEKTYQQVLADKAKRRSEILAVLFNLRDVSAIPFGKALEYANKKGLVTIALVGGKRGKMADIAKHTIVIDSLHYGRVEDAQMGILHMICYAFIEHPEWAKKK